MKRGLRQQLFPLLNGRVRPGLSLFFLPSFLQSSAGYSIPLSLFLGPSVPSVAPSSCLAQPLPGFGRVNE